MASVVVFQYFSDDLDRYFTCIYGDTLPTEAEVHDTCCTLAFLAQTPRNRWSPEQTENIRFYTIPDTYESEKSLLLPTSVMPIRIPSLFRRKNGENRENITKNVFLQSRKRFFADAQSYYV